MIVFRAKHDSLDALTKCTNHHGIRRIFFNVVLSCAAQVNANVDVSY